MTQQWEYLIAERFANGAWNCDDLAVAHELAGKTATSALHTLGKSGWELAHITPLDWADMTLILKRPGPID